MLGKVSGAIGSWAKHSLIAGDKNSVGLRIQAMKLDLNPSTSRYPSMPLGKPGCFSSEAEGFCH